MRVVLDTNILISGLFWGGIPRLIFNAALEKQFVTLSTEALAEEFKRVLNYSKFAHRIAERGLTVETLLNSYHAIVVSVVHAETVESVVRDPKDIAILACAVGGNADCIVSGDKDLTTLKGYQGIPIFDPSQFWEKLTR